MKLQFVMLGSGAVRDNPRRGGPSQILNIDNQILMFDCGRSASTNLAQRGIGCESVDRLFLTHLHFDHIVDVPYLVFVGWIKERENRLQIYGPNGTKDFVAKIIRPPFQQDIESRLMHGKDGTLLDPEVYEVLQANQFLLADRYQISSAFMNHAGIPTLAYRIDVGDKRIVITGDGVPDEQFPEFCQGADLLSIECSGTSEFLSQQAWGSWHIEPASIARIASEAGIKAVIIKHLVIEDITGDREIGNSMAKQIQSHYGGEVIVKSNKSVGILFIVSKQSSLYVLFISISPII